MKNIVIVLLMATLLVACGNADSNDSADSKVKVGASLLTASHPFQVAIKESMESEATANDIELTVAIADQDLNRQISDIEDFITKKVDVIVLTPVDSDGIRGAIQKAKDAGIPVVTVDVKANDIEVDAHIATDNYSGGMIAAEAMQQLIDGSGEIGLITYPEVQSVRDRIDGFKKTAALYPNMKIVTELPGRTREEALTASQDMLTSNPSIKGIFGFGDDMAIAATNAISEKKSEAIVVGFDGLKEAQDKVTEPNAFKAVVVQHPDQMGKASMEVAKKLAKGESVEKEIAITPGLFVEGKGMVDVKVNGDKVELNLSE
ncbi:substrate-binding domain-containing protein [Erysipelothrix sp. HDW6C]|nr:substrate-binding domain-containing protein [Erysipelothrix sp. HDW6C]